MGCGAVKAAPACVRFALTARVLVTALLRLLVTTVLQVTGVHHHQGLHRVRLAQKGNGTKVRATACARLALPANILHVVVQAAARLVQPATFVQVTLRLRVLQERSSKAAAQLVFLALLEHRVQQVQLPVLTWEMTPFLAALSRPSSISGFLTSLQRSVHTAR